MRSVVSVASLFPDKSGWDRMASGGIELPENCASYARYRPRQHIAINVPFTNQHSGLRALITHYCTTVSSYVAQYPVLRTAPSVLEDLFNQTPSQHLREAPSYAAIDTRRVLVNIPTTVYSQVCIYTAACTVAM